MELERENAEQAQKMEQIEGRLKQIETQNAQLIRELRGRAAAGGGGGGGGGGGSGV